MSTPTQPPLMQVPHRRRWWMVALSLIVPLIVSPIVWMTYRAAASGIDVFPRRRSGSEPPSPRVDVAAVSDPT